MINVIDLAKALIACPSITPRTAGVFDVLEAFLEPLGFTSHRITFEGDGGEPTENIYLRLGTAEPNFCFAGHTDVVPVGDVAAWKTPAFAPTIVNGELVGRGAEDMKGAVAAFMVAAFEFLETRQSFDDKGDKPAYDLPGSISFLITNDEEGNAINGTKKMLGWLAEKGEVISHCIVGEPTNVERLGDMVKIGRRGSITFNLTVRGVQGHAAYPERADNPVTRIIHMLHALKTTKLDDGTEHFPPSNLEVTSIDVGNPTTNVIPANASAKFNVRFNNLHTGAQIEQWARDICAPFGEIDLQARITGESFLTRDEKLIGIISKAVEKVTGSAPVLSTTGGTSDARFIKDVCPVIEFGTTGKTAHMVNERVEVACLEGLVEIYREVLIGYFS